MISIGMAIGWNIFAAVATRERALMQLVECIREFRAHREKERPGFRRIKRLSLVRSCLIGVVTCGVSQSFLKVNLRGREL